LAAAFDVPLSHAGPKRAERYDALGQAGLAILGFPWSRSGLNMAASAALLVLGVLVADAFALARVARLGRAELEERDPVEARDAGAVPSIDLGLGEDVRARVGRAANAYRSRARPLALLLGSAVEARAALRRALLRGAAGLALIGLVFGGHLWAET